MHTHTHTHTQTCSVILVRTTYRPPLFYIRLMICPNSTPNPKHHPHKNMIQLFMILTRDVWLTSSTCFTILVRTCFNREDILDLTTWTKLLKFFGQKLLHATSPFIYSVQHSRNVDIFLKLPVSHCTHSFTRTYTQCYLNSCVCSFMLFIAAIVTAVRLSFFSLHSCVKSLWQILLECNLLNLNSGNEFACMYIRQCSWKMV